MAALLKMSRISKSFPGVQALRDVDFNLRRGEVHALVGENGAGKSTLMKILSGMYRADAGRIELKGQEMTNAGVRGMLQAGISVIYQELNLIGHLSVAENVFLGREPLRRGGLIDWKTMHARVEELLAAFKINLNPRTKARRAGPAIQQVIEIVKALSLNSEILVMDEPTAPLTGSETDRLFEIIGNLKSKGVSIVYISHRLEELKHVADRVTILRDGQCVATENYSELGTETIVRHMVGRKLTEQYPRTERRIGEELLRVEGLSREGICRNVNFAVRSGEILGFTGLVGAGRTEIMELLYGHRRRDSGRVLLRGREIRIRRPRDAVRQGMGLIPEERKRQGLVLGLSVFDNTAITVLNLYSKFGFLRRGAIGEKVKAMMAAMAVKTPSLRRQVRYLSGGNQQKLVLSKWFIRDCLVYIFDEPTRGIDVGAKVEIYKLMQALAAKGAAILMVSSELPEIMNMSDRTAVVCNGRIVREFARGEAGEEEVMEYSLGLREGEAPRVIRLGLKPLMKNYGIAVAFLFVCTVLAILSPVFLTTMNIVNIVRQTSIYGIMAVGMTFVILTGGIDLSVGSLLAISGAACAAMLKAGYGTLPAVTVTLITGTAFGLVNGVIINAGRITPFVATLGMMSIARGLTMIFTRGYPISGFGSAFRAIGGGYLAGIPIPIIMFAAAVALAWLILTQTRLGRYTYAIGGNEETVRLSGINAPLIKTIIYGIMGLTAAVSSLILTSRLNSAEPIAGTGYELDVIAAVVIGGTSLSGGRGAIWGTFVGALLIGVINNGMNLLGISAYFQLVVKGTIIIGAVLLDRLRD